MHIKINCTKNVFIEKYILNKIKKYISLIMKNFFIKYIVDITVTDNNTIRKLNKKFRNIDLHTDVLSFPIYNFKHSFLLEKIYENKSNKIFIGDIIISYETIIKQALQLNNTIEKEFIYLFIHSMLHLTGYDHNNEYEKKIMRIQEKKILNNLSFEI